MNRSRPALPRPASRTFQALLALVALGAAPARAQLDLGSHDVPQDSIDAYLEPFYRLVAAGLGADRNLPVAAGSRIGWHAGLQGGAVPIPSGKPFQEVAISLLPLFRAEGGLHLGPVGVMGRGLAWSDPRMGGLTTYGGALSAGHAFRGLHLPGGRIGAAEAAVLLGWDRLEFSSEYTYRYRGSVLALFDQDIPGDYELSENLTAGGLMGAFGMGRWRLHAETLLEWADARFRYLYLDPRTGKQARVSSEYAALGFRAAGGLSWRGFRAQAGWRSYPYFAFGWSWIR